MKGLANHSPLDHWCKSDRLMQFHPILHVLMTHRLWLKQMHKLKLWIKSYATFIQERRIWLFCGSIASVFSFHKRSANKKQSCASLFFFLMTLFANKVIKLKVELFSNLMPFMRQWGRKTIMNEILINARVSRKCFVAYYRYWIENILDTNSYSKKIPGKVNRPIKNSLASSHVVQVMKSIHYSYHVYL